ncbi:MAG: 3-oxo-tetronate kinase [Pseudomonadota bacterium]
MLLGCIGDDFTGSSDLANTLAKQGMRVVQYSGVPDADAGPDVQAGVISLKTRSIAAAGAVAQSLAALKWLQAQGCRQFVFKYCSTFDSTPAGNIGPVIDALADALDARTVIVCPAFPGTGRSLYQGHLFVNDVLLNESGMQNHPLTPMTDADIRRWLRPQTRHGVGHVNAQHVLRGSQAIEQALAAQADGGNRLVVVDAIDDANLIDIGRAARDLKLITGGSGIAIGLPANFDIAPSDVPWQPQPGKTIVLSGSCSNATREQVALHASQHPALELEADKVLGGETSAAHVADWLMSQPGLPLVYSSSDPDRVAQVQAQYGRERAADAFERLFAETAALCRARGATRIITAGGETSGAIVEGLDLRSLTIGPEIDPGVPALRADDGLVVALKSGNFGAPDFFAKAATVLGGSQT